MKTFKFYFLLSCLALIQPLMATQLRDPSFDQLYPIIPQPKSIEFKEQHLLLSSFSLKGDLFSNEKQMLHDFFVSKGLSENSNGVQIKLVQKDVTKDKNPEAYHLKINNQITISASGPKGVFYAIQSLKQLIRLESNVIRVPYVSIQDAPSFKIRGFMHDTGRNFQSLEQLKEQIEILSQYKYNVFHWHLTDNPGWRLESKIYPQLQSEKATSRKPGMYYSQEDFKEIVAFCKARHMIVIPEFDIPGHTEAFRKAFDNASMSDPKIQLILIDLIEELAGLANKEDVPYIHLGTDEVRKKEEQIPENYLLPLFEKVRALGREVIVWKQGITVEQDSTSINQLWASYKVRKGHRFIDSRASYINHLDPFTAATRLFYQQPCEVPYGNDLALGGILCVWPDNRVEDERDILRQNPIYPSLVFYADAIWNGKKENKKSNWANLPSEGSEDYLIFKDFENKVLTHRDLYFNGKEFQYIKQTDFKWNIIGPFDHDGDVNKLFEVEDQIKEHYVVNDSLYRWSGPHIGGTTHFKHFFGFPSLTEKDSGTYYAYTMIYSPNNRVQDFWIGFHGWSRSGGRRGGPFPALGQWHITNPKIWINDKLVAPPVWKQPGLGVHTDEIPFIDEDYFYREPTKITLKKGWNKVLIKVPFTKNNFKWMFTCVPVAIDGNNVREVNELIFKTPFNE